MNMPKSRGKIGRNAFLLVTGSIGVILFWRGVWALADGTPILENPWVSLFLGLVILVLSHQFYREL